MVSNIYDFLTYAISYKEQEFQEEANRYNELIQSKNEEILLNQQKLLSLQAELQRLHTFKLSIEKEA